MRNMKFVKRIGVVALAACMILSCVGCGSSSNKGAAEGTTEIAAEGGQTKISVAAAASLQATFDDELIPLFEKENPGVTVEGTYASSGDLQQQIESGLDADVFFSAATSNMDTLVDENLVDKDTVVDLLKNDVVLITPKDSKLGIKGFKDITKADTIAIIVRGNRIISATCYLPLSDNMELSKELGTRHRAGVGISEVTDSLTIIVSEETGKVSIAQKGVLTRDVTPEELKEQLVILQDKNVNTKRFKFWKGKGKNEENINQNKENIDQ